MRRFALLPFIIFSVACSAGEQAPVEMSAAAQTQLTEELRGRVAEPTRNCVNTRDLGGNRSVGEDVLIFDARVGDLVYVNRPPGGCPDLRNSYALVTRTTSTQLCRGDIAIVRDMTSGIEHGGCGLGDFTPYRRVR